MKMYIYLPAGFIMGIIEAFGRCEEIKKTSVK